MSTSAASARASRLRAMPSCSASSRFREAFAQAGGVDEFDGNAAEGDALGDQVARGAGSGGDDGAVALDEAIEERAFAGVGAADDGEGEAVVHDAAAGKGGFERGERRGELGDAPGDFLLRRDVEVVFGEVDAGFKQGDQFDERLLDGRDAAAERAAHLAGGLARLGEGLRFDEVADGFSLREVEAAGEEGALREFAGLGEARAQRRARGATAAPAPPASRARQFRPGLRRCRSWARRRMSPGLRRCVWLRRARGFIGAVEHIGQTRAGVFERMAQADQLHGDGCSLRTAEAHDADATASRRRGDGGDGVGNRGGRGHFSPQCSARGGQALKHDSRPIGNEERVQFGKVTRRSIPK